MVPELEKVRVTEIQVRMDCNGCVQKIRKALQGIQGIYDIYPDIAQQKLTVIGWADPERIVKAIRKTRKIATICSHSEPNEPPAAAAQPTDELPEGGPPPAPEPANPPPPEAPPAEAAPPQPEAEPPKDQPPPENPQPEPAPPAATDGNASSSQMPPQHSGPKEVGKVHVICHHPPDYGHRYGSVHSCGGPWSRVQYHNNSQGNNFYPDQPISRHPSSQVFHHEPPPPQPAFVTHTSYNTYKPSPPQPAFVTHTSYNTYKPSPYVTEYEYASSPPRYTHYTRIDHYNEDYHNYYSTGSSSNSSSGHGNGNITSMFSDENPNACRVM